MRYAGCMRAGALCGGLLGFVLIVAPTSARLAPYDGIGGDGGAPFRVDCGEYGVLVGVTGRSGVVVDSIAGLCVKIDPVSGTWIGGIYETDRRGGGGGGAFNKKCSVGQAVVGITGTIARFNDSTVLGSISIHCMPLGIYTEYTPSVIKATEIVFTPENQSPQNTDSILEQPCTELHPMKGHNDRVWSRIGIALEGRSGLYVDRIRLGCGEILQDRGGYRITFQPSSNISVPEGTPLKIAWRAMGTKPEFTPNLESEWSLKDWTHTNAGGFGFTNPTNVNGCAYAMQPCSSSWFASSSGSSVTFNSLPPASYEIDVTVRPTVPPATNYQPGLGQSTLRFVVRSNLIESLAFSPTSINAGSATTATVKLEGPVSPKGRVLHLASSNPNLAAVPDTITVPGGSDKATFSIRANPSLSDGGEATISVSTKAPIALALDKNAKLGVYTRGLPDETEPAADGQGPSEAKSEASMPTAEPKDEAAADNVREDDAVTERGVNLQAYGKATPNIGVMAQKPSLIITPSTSGALDKSATVKPAPELKASTAGASEFIKLLPGETKQAVLKVLPNNVRMDKR